MAPSASRYMPLRVMCDGGKLLVQCSLDFYFDKERKVVIQIYDPRTGSLMHVKCIHDLCTLPLDIPPYLRHILVIFMLFDDYWE
jgi:hypothetical protein